MTRFGSGALAFRHRVAALPKPLRIAFLVLFAVLLYLLPVLNLPVITTPDTDFAGVLFTMAIYGLVALGLNIVVGYAGLLDLGYVGFYAIGAYTIAVMTTEHAKWPFLLVIPLAVAMTMISGVLLGAPTLRVRGDYLAIVTLGFGEIIRLTIVNSEWLGGAAGISGVGRPQNIEIAQIPTLEWTPQPLVNLDDTVTVLTFSGPGSAMTWYWFALSVIIVVLFADRLIKDSRVGRSWEATREDEDAAELMGVPTFRFKLLAFSMGAFVGGLAGALFAGRQGYVSPQSFALLLSILFLASVVLGGQGNRWGVLVGAALVVYIPERFRGLADWRVLVFGLVLMLLAIYRPQGLLPPARTIRATQAAHEIEALEQGEEEPEDDDGETASVEGKEGSRG